MAILVTGGAGFIGSHTCVELLEAGYEVVVVDNLYNASRKSMDRIEQITGKKPIFYEADILDREALNKIFEKEQIDSVIHFAGLKAVGESVAKPIEYYYNNIAGTLVLCDVRISYSAPLLPYTEIRPLFPLPRSAPRGRSPIPTVRLRVCLSRCLRTFMYPTPSGM